MELPYDGGCQCGAVRYRITGEPDIVFVCHCTICQNQSGSAFGMGLRVQVDHFHLTQGALNSFQRTAESGRVFTNSFCPECGTRIYHTNDRRPEQISVKPGTLDDTTGLRPTVHLWVRNKQPWVVIPDDVKAFDTQPEDPNWALGRRA